ncbi:Sel-1 suppressor of lin-12-like, partial [Perkinsus olseni]
RRQAGERVDRGNRADRGLLGGVMGKCGVLLAMMLAFFALDVLQFIIFGDDDTSTEPLTYWSSGNGGGGRVDHVEDATSRVESSWQASEGPAVELRFQAAMDALNTGHLKESYDKFYALYQTSGNLTALAYAGQTQLPLNSTRGAELLELAANQGEPHAQFMLGLYYSNNRGDPYRITNPGEHEKDYGKGILYLYASSTAGHTGALMTMGYRHLFGYGVPRNCETAAMNYIEIAQRIAHIYSTGLPQAVELVRLNLQGV